MTSEYGLPLSPEQIDQRKREQIKTKYYIRLRPAYFAFFQAMARDYYERGKIKEPSIGLLAKTCLITAGNAWNRMQAQLKNNNYQRKMLQQQEQQQQQKQQQQQEQNYQRHLVQTSGQKVPQSLPSIKPPSVVIKEWGYPTSAPRLDTSNLAAKRSQHHQSQPQTEEQYYYDGDYGASY